MAFAKDFFVYASLPFSRKAAANLDDLSNIFPPLINKLKQNQHSTSSFSCCNDKKIEFLELGKVRLSTSSNLNIL